MSAPIIDIPNMFIFNISKKEKMTIKLNMGIFSGQSFPYKNRHTQTFNVNAILS